MRDHRLERLRLLTQGIALLGLGGEAACHSQAPEPLHMNAPELVYDAGQPNPPPSASAALPTDANTASAPPTSGSAPIPDPVSKPPVLVPHMNATAPPPKTVNAPPKH
jgi:hypothetical protein